MASATGLPSVARPKDSQGTEYSQGSVIHHRGPLGTFIDTLDNPEVCGNLLDAGSQDLARPWFVRCEKILAAIMCF